MAVEWEILNTNGGVDAQQTIIEDIAFFNGKIYVGGQGQGRLFELSGPDFVTVAPLYTNFYSVRALHVFNGILKATGYQYGRLVDWNGTDAWVHVAWGPHGASGLTCLRMFDDGLNVYAVDNVGALLRWNGASAWVIDCPIKMGSATWMRTTSGFINSSLEIYAAGQGGCLLKKNGSAWDTLLDETQFAATSIHVVDLIQHTDGKIYGVTWSSSDVPEAGRLVRYDDVAGAWEFVSAKITGVHGLQCLISYKNKILVGGHIGNAHLYIWNDIDTLVKYAEDTGLAAEEIRTLVYNPIEDRVYAGTWTNSGNGPYLLKLPPFPEASPGGHVEVENGDMTFIYGDSGAPADILPVSGSSDMARDPGFETTVIIALFSDGRASDSDILPRTQKSRRGWWGDALTDFPIGSKIWLLDRTKLTGVTLALLDQYVQEALEPLITQNIANSIESVSTRDGLNRSKTQITIKRVSGENVLFEFYLNWKYQTTGQL